ncbi:ABC transporter family protein [Cryptosporidium felis]|nr:ABC transporter family protein [Cryptosporidium felis]
MKLWLFQIYSNITLSWVNQFALKNEPRLEDLNFTRREATSLGKNLLYGCENQVALVQRKFLKKGSFKIGGWVIRCFKWEFLYCILLKIVVICISFRLNSSFKSFIGGGYILGQIKSGFFFFSLYTLKILLDMQLNLKIARLSLKIQTSLIGIVYERLLTTERISASIQESNDRINQKMPNIYNIIFGDLNSVEAFIQALIELLTSPIKIFGVWILLHMQIGFSANVSVVAYLSLFLISQILQIIGATYKWNFMKLRDIRISRCHEYFSSFTTIRQLFWEDLVFEDLQSIREREVQANLHRFLFLMSGTFLEYNSHLLAKFLLFCSFAYLNHNQRHSDTSLKITIASGLSTLHALNLLTGPTRNIVSTILEGIISLRRIKEFFERSSQNSLFKEMGSVILFKNSNETENISINAPKCISDKTPYPSNINKNYVLFEFVNSNPSNTDSSESSCLIGTTQKNQVIIKLLSNNLFFRDKELCILLGESGSGKSVLINYLLEKFDSIGYLNYMNICYSSQNIWLPKGSIKSIILFGKKYDQSNYQRVVNACSLEKDFLMWPDGDLRQIDESDQTLSNGQKSRISLARALYYLADIQKNYENRRVLVILDDIFSSLDEKVSREIFENLFGEKGLLFEIPCILTCNTYKIMELLGQDNIFKMSIRVMILKEGLITYDNFLNEYLKIEYNLKVETPLDTPRVDKVILDREVGRTGIYPENNYPRDPNNMALNEENRQKKKIGLFGEVFDYKYFYYIRYVGYTYFMLFLIVCIFKIGITKQIEICITKYMAEISTSRASSNSFLFYLGLMVLVKLVLDCFSFVSEAIISAKASRHIHKNYLISLLSANNDFYSSIPISKVLNRFNLDLLILDDILIRKMVGVFIRLFDPLVQILIILYMSPPLFVLLFTHIIFITHCFGIPLLNLYKKTQKDILAISSDLSNNFSETKEGLGIIKEFGNKNLYKLRVYENLEGMIESKLMQIYVTQWSSIRIQFFSGPLAILLYTIYIFYLYFMHNYSPLEEVNPMGLEIGYGIYYLISYSDTLNLIFTKISTLEKEMCSLERVLEYSDVDNKQDIWDPEESNSEKFLGSQQPTLKFENVDLSYKKVDFTVNQNHFCFKVIENFTLELGKGEHVGIIGRTGSGKSTLVKAISGIVTPSFGKILLNGVDICSLSKRDRRRMIGIVSQTPLKMSSWTIRKYLDPYSKFSQNDILDILKFTGFYYAMNYYLDGNCDLESIKLSDINRKYFGSFTEFHLKYLNFVRLLLNRKQYSLIVLDEPTPTSHGNSECIQLLSSIRPFKLVSVEDLIKTHFQHCTVIIISHDSKILKHCDRIIDLSKS